MGQCSKRKLTNVLFHTQVLLVLLDFSSKILFKHVNLQISENIDFGCTFAWRCTCPSRWGPAWHVAGPALTAAVALPEHPVPPASFSCACSSPPPTADADRPFTWTQQRGVKISVKLGALVGKDHHNDFLQRDITDCWWSFYMCFSTSIVSSPTMKLFPTLRQKGFFLWWASVRLRLARLFQTYWTTDGTAREYLGVEYMN